jgi:hypothetical protein
MARTLVPPSAAEGWDEVWVRIRARARVRVKVSPNRNQLSLT